MLFFLFSSFSFFNWKHNQLSVQSSWNNGCVGIGMDLSILQHGAVRLLWLFKQRKQLLIHRLKHKHILESMYGFLKTGFTHKNWGAQTPTYCFFSICRGMKCRVFALFPLCNPCIVKIVIQYIWKQCKPPTVYTLIRLLKTVGWGWGRLTFYLWTQHLRQKKKPC